MQSFSIRPPSSARAPRLASVAPLLTALALLTGLVLLWPQPAHGQSATPVIHLPYQGGSPDPARGAVFWFGAVNQTSNAADVRMAYTDNELIVVLHVFDRRAHFDPAAGLAGDLTKWDGASLYLDTQGDGAAPLGGQSYRFDAQISQARSRANDQRAYRWQGDWQAAAVAFTTTSGYRGDPNDAQDDRGWTLSFRIPFTSLGLAAPPATGSMWRMGLALHDRDDAAGAPVADTYWPAEAALNRPATWGRIAFGAPVYTPLPAANPKTVTLRHGVNNIVAPDAAVGGHSMCGAQFNPNFFDGWGEANYGGITQINIQNQWDVADWPCFSRYYVTFPLASLPNAAQVVSATLTLYMFGNAGYDADDARPSLIQVARVAGDWTEATLTWNNAPPVLENHGWAVVNPMQAGNPVARPVTWDVTGAVAASLGAGQPLRLALYSSDGDYHSGKYFWSADAGENLRPHLAITWGAQGYALSASPSSQVLAGGKTVSYQLNVTGLGSGEQVTLEVGPSSPNGLAVSVSPATIAAPGGKAVVTVTDRSGGGQQASGLYKVPVRATNGQTVRSVDLAVLINGQQLFLPAIQR